MVIWWYYGQLAGNEFPVLALPFLVYGIDSHGIGRCISDNTGGWI